MDEAHCRVFILSELPVAQAASVGHRAVCFVNRIGWGRRGLVSISVRRRTKEDRRSQGDRRIGRPGSCDVCEGVTCGVVVGGRVLFSKVSDLLADAAIGLDNLPPGSRSRPGPFRGGDRGLGLGGDDRLIRGADDQRCAGPIRLKNL